MDKLYDAWQITFKKDYFNLSFGHVDESKDIDPNSNKISSDKVIDVTQVQISPIILKRIIVDLIDKGLMYEKENDIKIGISDLIIKEDENDE